MDLNMNDVAEELNGNGTCIPVIEGNDPFIASQQVDFVQDFTSLSDDAWLDNYVGLETQIQTSLEDDTSSSTDQAHLAKKYSELNKKKLPIPDEDLADMPVRDLNKKIRSLELTKPQIQAIRKRRRSLKNRGYALSCRHRRVTENVELSRENEKLNKELKKLKDELSRTLKERDILKKKYEKMNGYFNTITASALSFGGKGVILTQKG